MCIAHQCTSRQTRHPNSMPCLVLRGGKTISRGYQNADSLKMWNWRNSNLKQKFLAQDAVTNLKSLLCIFNYTCIREPRNTFVIAIYGKEDHVWEIFIKSVIFNSLVLIWFCNLVLAVPSSAAAMKVINTNQLVEIPDGVEASVKSRVVTVKVRKKGRAVKFPLWDQKRLALAK